MWELNFLRESDFEGSLAAAAAWRWGRSARRSFAGLNLVFQEHMVEAEGHRKKEGRGNRQFTGRAEGLG